MDFQEIEEEANYELTFRSDQEHTQSMDVKSESGVKETIDSKSNNTFWKGIFDHYLLFAVEC